LLSSMPQARRLWACCGSPSRVGVNLPRGPSLEGEGLLVVRDHQAQCGDPRLDDLDRLLELVGDGRRIQPEVDTVAQLLVLLLTPRLTEGHGGPGAGDLRRRRCDRRIGCRPAVGA